MEDEAKKASETGLGEQRYTALETNRSPYLSRARECSELTIPSLIPPDGTSGSTNLDTPYQSVGAKGVNKLGGKLLMAILPPNQSFFKHDIDDFTLDELAKKEGARAEVEKALGSIERAVQKKIERDALRVPLFEALKHLLVAGNILLYMPPEGGMRVFHLPYYVIKRAPDGTLLEIIVKEELSPDQIPESIKDQLKQDTTEESTEKTVAMFTYIRKHGKKYHIHQEVKGIIVPSSVGRYPADKLPWFALRYTRIEGEDYGRGFIEEYLGDLKSLDGLMQSLIEGAAASARFLFMVDPNGTTDQETVAEAENGDVVEGNANEVTVLQAGKHADLSVAERAIARLEDRLNEAFLMHSSIQRKGERVTATEWNILASELDDALGGLYGLLAQDFQLPLVNILMWRLAKAKKIPKLPKDIVTPTIITGLEALGKGQDLQTLKEFVREVVELAPVIPEVAQRINVGDLLTRLATARGIDEKGLIKTDDDIKALQAAQEEKANQDQSNGMMTELAGKLGPEAMKQMGNMSEQPTPQGT